MEREKNEVTRLSDSRDSSKRRVFKAVFQIGIWAFVFAIAAEWSEIMEMVGKKGSVITSIVGIIPSWFYSMIAVAAFAYLLYGLRDHILKYVIPQGAKLMINIMMFTAVIDILLEIIWGLSDDVEISTLKTYAIIYGLIFAAGGFSLIKVIKNSLAYSFIAYGVIFIAMMLYFYNAMESVTDVKDLGIAVTLLQIVNLIIYAILNAQIATYLGVDLKKKKDGEDDAE